MHKTRESIDAQQSALTHDCFTALFYRHSVLHNSKFDSKKSALKSLMMDNESGDIFPVAIIDNSSNKMCWFNSHISENQCNTIVQKYLSESDQSKT